MADYLTTNFFQMENVLFLPGNEAELVELYLDKKHGAMIGKHSLYKIALAKRLERENLVPETDALTEFELGERCRELSRQLFIEAMRGFANRLCSEQRAICSHKFMIAPIGNEESWIESAPMPPVCKKSQHRTLREFWQSLAQDEIKELMEQLPDIFGGNDARESLEDYAARVEESPEDDDTLVNFCTERWDEIPVEDKFRVCNHHNATLKVYE